MKTLTTILIVVLIFSIPAFAQKGEIRGKVLDQENLQPLIGVNILIKGTTLGAATDVNGQYVVKKVPVGIYQLIFTYMGYEKKIVPDVVITNSRINYVNNELSWQAVEGEEVVVTAGYYSKPEDAPVSVQSLSYEEIRRSPGAREDVSRMLQNLPGVNLTSDDRNDLVVRGGSPSEVLFRIDNFDIPNPNHFGTQGATGGPISMVNSEFIDNVKFMAGGFTAPYGHKVSGAMDIQYREGNRQNFEGKIDLNVAGAGGYVEGPIQNGRGSYLFGLHRSYLDIMESLLDYGGLPIYSNIQGKMVYDMNKNNQLSLLLIGGDDRINIEDKTDVEDFHPGVVDTVDYYSVVNKLRQYTAGISLRTFWRDNLYSVFSASHSYNRYYIDNNMLSRSGFRTSEKKLNNETTVLNADLYDNTSIEQQTTFKSDWTWALPNHDGLSFGAYVKLFQFDHDITYIPAYPNQQDSYGQISSISIVKVNQKMTPKVGGYVNYKKLITKNFIANLGGRYDYFDLIKTGNFSPRLGLHWNVSHRLAFNAGIGTYYQNPELVYITGYSTNKDLLKDIRADHYIVGLEYLLTADTRFTMEAYHKKYFDYPVMADSGYEMISMANMGSEYGSVESEKLLSEGEGEVSGFELMIQKKLAEQLYGLMSYSYSTIKHKALDGIFRNGEFDNQHVFNLVLGYRLNKNWEFSIKWRYAGGTPYTPFDEQASQASDDEILDLTRINDVRYEPYHRIDLRFDHRKFFSKVTLVTYFSIENVYNRKNQRDAFWNNEQSRTEFYYQTGIFPVGGFSLEF